MDAGTPPRTVVSCSLEVKTTPRLAVDLDGTLLDVGTGTPFPTALAVLKHLMEQGFQLYLASFNPDGEKLVQTLGIRDWFIDVSCGKIGKRRTKLANLAAMKLHQNDTVLIDDDALAVDEARRKGWMCMEVNRETGLRWRDLQRLLPPIQP